LYEGLKVSQAAGNVKAVISELRLEPMTT
jgi:hypothetical protein